ncbi:Maternal embryonic leucine zipper kinase [Sarcoptes scabiei]|uniref:non-specific serine/threonine protein kinase n=1 Tax=Sarcoptes scabiei TaxID=52283 RepID=A0A834VH59_SARSC|nr:Maternal embryonic leucine zipper kinase [Sarcoptes scabiei]UXI15311.1 hypothetical protein NH340_JMT01254 [Sarcoptes scabiei]
MDPILKHEYHIHSKKLGEGGFGVVKLATHLLTNQKVAIKIINKEKIKKDLFRVKNEITALRALRHKNVAKLLQIIENNQYIFLVLEYCSGGELFDYLVSKSRLTENESRRIIRALILVLAYIHSKGFAHRDIKPENILLDENLNIKLIDFGLCACSNMSPSGNLDGLSTCCGSPAYVAPELLAGSKYSGPVADVWSTGILLYALTCGRLPFNNPNLALLYKAIKEGKFELPKYLSNSVKDLITRMLCVDPKRRITLKEIVQHRWMSNCDPEWTRYKNLSSEIAREDESLIDEKILLKCSALFPDIDLNTLRLKIQSDCDYHCATYWLVKQRPELYKDFDPSIQIESINRRRSRSFSEFNLPKIKKMIADIDKNHNIQNKQILEDKDPKTPILHPKTEVKRDLDKASFVNGFKRPVVKKKLFADFPNSINSRKRPIEAPTIELSPILPLASSRLENKENIAEITRKTKVRSLENTANGCQTPSMTPKRSLFKWILETATPRKSFTPRRYSMNDQKSLRNLIMTNCRNADECVSRIVEILKIKQVNCRAKNFVIRCVLSTMNVIIVAFELEILVCRNTGRVAIQHKRIRGTSWDYVKICDDIRNELDKIFTI